MREQIGQVVSRPCAAPGSSAGRHSENGCSPRFAYAVFTSVRGTPLCAKGVTGVSHAHTSAASSSATRYVRSRWRGDRAPSNAAHVELPLITLKIHHRTTYYYRQPVSLGPHRLMLRPRESRDLRLISSDLAVVPPAMVSWSHDVFGNAVATATFRTMSDNLIIDSVAELQLNTVAWPVFDIAASAISYPFRYSDDEWTDLGALTVREYPDPAGRLQGWARAFVRGNSTDTLALLKDLSVGVSAWIGYEIREEPGIQWPTQTLDRGSGSCRDFAVLFIEAVRSLGFGGRIVSGYLYNPDQDIVGSRGAGSTHAWAEVYVPGAGWITFDPTNRSVGGFNLIPVAVARNIRQAMPVAGSFVGMTDAFQGTSVEVSVTA
jgi:transglutaminase-like putative cysteine protease